MPSLPSLSYQLSTGRGFPLAGHSVYDARPYRLREIARSASWTRWTEPLSPSQVSWRLVLQKIPLTEWVFQLHWAGPCSMSQWGKQNVFYAGLATFGNTQVVSLSYSEISRSQVKPRACFPLPATPMFETPVALCAPNSQKRGGTKAPVRSNEAQSTKTCRLSSNTTFYIWAWWIVLNVRMFRFLGTQLGAIACAFSKLSGL